MMYRICPDCGAALDPGEICDCQYKEEAAPGATNTQSGKVEQKSDQPNCSTSILPENKEEIKYENVEA